LPESVCRHFRIDADHPCLDGHFPGRPVVPGVILLDLVRLTIREWKPETRIKSFSAAKFHHPLGPDEPFTVTLTETGLLSLRFVCCRGDQKLASGSLTLEKRD
jgi:3-hydroxymyristoyl/3-hydroxydecanoyl-(acyl carrier protein) dehydratase